MSPSSYDVPVAGGSLAVFELGEAPESAPVVLAAHGITSNSRAWVAVARALGDRVRLLAVDLRGRGDSRTLPAPYGLAAHAADLIAVLDHRGLDQAVITGHSLGAYILAWLGVAHPDRVRHAVLVDGGLRIPGVQAQDPRAAAAKLLGPALERLEMRFPTPEAYVEWWRSHPALKDSDVADDDLADYAKHDLVGEPPEFRSSVSGEAVAADGEDLFGQEERAAQLAIPATLLCAPAGLLGEPNPMQPFELAQAWAAGAPELRHAELVPGVNHYTITLGQAGSDVVAGALLRALA